MKSTLHLSVGIPGSGKSTHAKKFCFTNLIDRISSDELRAQFGTGEQDQTVSAEVFGFIERQVEKYMIHGLDIFVDATHYNRKGRKRVIAIARKYGANVVAHVANTPFDVCKARNAARERVVPEFVLERMHKGFEFPTIGEVDSIVWVNQDEKKD